MGDGARISNDFVAHVLTSGEQFSDSTVSQPLHEGCSSVKSTASHPSQPPIHREGASLSATVCACHDEVQKKLDLILRACVDLLPHDRVADVELRSSCADPCSEDHSDTRSALPAHQLVGHESDSDDLYRKLPPLPMCPIILP